MANRSTETQAYYPQRRTVALDEQCYADTDEDPTENAGEELPAVGRQSERFS